MIFFRLDPRMEPMATNTRRRGLRGGASRGDEGVVPGGAPVRNPSVGLLMSITCL